VNFLNVPDAPECTNRMHRFHLKRSGTAGGSPMGAHPRFGAFTLMELLVVIVMIAALAALVVSNVDRTTDEAESVTAEALLGTVREAFIGSAVGPGYIADMKYVPGFRSVLVRTHDLLFQGDQPQFDPAARRGWRGPYVRNAAGVKNLNPARNGAFPAGEERRFAGDATFLERGFFTDAGTSPYGATGDLAVADPWGNPIVLQVPRESAFEGSRRDAKRFRYARLVSAGADGVLSTPLDRLAGMLVDGSTPERGDDLVFFLNRSDIYETEEL
jgi:type II secretory pathway pseudopilin PulG